MKCCVGRGTRTQQKLCIVTGLVDLLSFIHLRIKHLYRVSRYLERPGYLYRDAETEYLDLVSEQDDTMHGIIGASIQAVPTGDNRANSSKLVSKQSGFSLHAGVACKSNQRKKLERLCRYITRPAIAEQRLSLASIEDPDVIEKILKHLGLDETSQVRNRSPPSDLFDYSSQLF